MPGRRRRPEEQRSSPASTRYHKPLPPLRRAPEQWPGGRAIWVSSRPLQDGPTALKLLRVDLPASEATLQYPDRLLATRTEPGHGPHAEADQSPHDQETREPHPPAHAEHRAHLTAQCDLLLPRFLSCSSLACLPLPCFINSTGRAGVGFHRSEARRRLDRPACTGPLL